MKKFFIRRWFLISLAVVLVLGMSTCSVLKPLAEHRLLRYAIVATVLFLMALPLEARTMWRAIRRPRAPLLAVFINFGLLPLLAWVISHGLSADMGLGLLVAATTPSTLASASVWTRRAGGNDSVSILVTIITNLGCFVVTPLWLVIMTGRAPDSEALQLGNMVVKLGLLVLLPMLVAQGVRIYGPAGAWATANKNRLGVLAQCGILSMILLGAIQTGSSLSSRATPLVPSEILLMVVAVLGVHVAMLMTGLGMAQMLGIGRQDRIAVAFSGSQKTLMVGLQVGMDLGISILPMVVYHVGQLLVDTLVADRFRMHGDRLGRPASVFPKAEPRAVK